MEMFTRNQPAKTVMTEMGDIEVRTPRDREGNYEPQIVKKHQNDLSEMNIVTESCKISKNLEQDLWASKSEKAICYIAQASCGQGRGRRAK